MKWLRDENEERLYLELHAFENQGITIWLEGAISDSINVTNRLSLNEEQSYMRDYIFEEGILKEIRFDKVTQNK